MLASATLAAAPSVSPRPQGPSWLPYALAVALISALVVCLATMTALEAKQRNRERTTVATQNIARLLEQNISSEFDKVDLVLQLVAAHYLEQATTGRPRQDVRFNAYLAQRQAQIPGILNLTDRDGTVSHGQDIRTQDRVSLVDREFFIRARDDSNAGLVVDGPVLARISRQWEIVLARRLVAPDGSFAGIVYANLNTEHFDTALSSLALGPAGAATLRTRAMALVHRVPMVGNAVGSKAMSTRLRDIMAAGSAAGDYLAVTTLDGIERSNAYRKLPHYPFYVIVGLATDDSLAGWKSNTLPLAVLAALLILTTGLAALALFRNARRLTLDIAARKITEADLRAALHEAEDLYHNAPGGYHSLGADGTILRINDTELRWLGYERAELVGHKRMQDLLTAASRAVFDEHFPRLKESGVLRDLRHDMVRRDGSILPVQINATVIRDENGAFRMSRTTVLDLSEIRQAESRLQEAQRLARLGSWQVDLVSKSVIWSDEMLEIYDLPGAVVVPLRMPCPPTIHPEDRQHLESAFASAVSTCSALDTRFRVLTRAGEIRTIHMLGRVQIDDAGRPLRILGTAQDISLATRQAEALQESEARYRHVIEDQTELIGRFRIDGTMVFANDVYARFFGKTVAEIVGQRWHPVAHPEDRLPIEAQLRAIVPDHPVAVIENRVYSGNGELRWVQFVNRGFFDANGQLSEIQSVGRDITERVHNAERIDQLMREQKAILDSRNVGFVKVKARTFTWCNDALAEMLGYTTDELTGQSTRMVYPDDEACSSHAKTAYPQILRGEVFRAEIQYRRKDGSLGWYEVSASSLAPGSDESIWALIDITSRKAVELALASGESRLRHIFGTMTEGLVLYGRECEIFDANQAAADILGLSPGETLGIGPKNSPWKTVHEDGSTFLDSEHPARVTLRTGQPLRGQTIGIHTPRRGLRWISVNSSLLCDHHPDANNAVVVTFSDITDHVENLALLKIACDRLEMQNDDQAARLRQLAGDLVLAEQRERDHLFALLHDELQPLLVAARLSLSSINAATPAATSVHLASAACAHIGQVLGLARTLSTELTPPLIREHGLIPALESLFRWVKDNHRLGVTLIAAPDTEPEDMAIRICCVSVVRELLLNVVKHAGATHASVELRSADDHTLDILVCDDGIGFDPSVATSSSGLASISGRLKMFGGRLEIASQAGQTCITASVPRRLVDSARS